MQFLTLPEALAHLRADAGLEDDLITLYASAAEQAAIDYLNRQVYATQAALDADQANAGESPMVINFAVKAAMLLILGHLYANREDAVVGATAAALPMGARMLLRQHRVRPGF